MALKAARVRGAAQLIGVDVYDYRLEIAKRTTGADTINADTLNGNITNDIGLPIRKGKYIGRDFVIYFVTKSNIIISIFNFLHHTSD